MSEAEALFFPLFRAILVRYGGTICGHIRPATGTPKNRLRNNAETNQSTNQQTNNRPVPHFFPREEESEQPTRQCGESRGRRTPAAFFSSSSPHTLQLELGSLLFFSLDGTEKNYRMDPRTQQRILRHGLSCIYCSSCGFALLFFLVCF
jgi:hypothetical protein